MTSGGATTIFKALVEVRRSLFPASARISSPAALLAESRPGQRIQAVLAHQNAGRKWLTAPIKICSFVARHPLNKIRWRIPRPRCNFYIDPARQTLADIPQRTRLHRDFCRHRDENRWIHLIKLQLVPINRTPFQLASKRRFQACLNPGFVAGGDRPVDVDLQCEDRAG